MPTYTVTVANLSLSLQQKSQIAEAITTAHHTQTGAPRFFAQVLFFATNEGEHFVGGRVNSAPQVYVHGLVREGRNTEVKQALMSQMLEKVVQITGITAEDVWIYLQDIPATQMIEFGRFLPAPGDEAEWEKEKKTGTDLFSRRITQQGDTMSYTSRYTPETLSRDELDHSTGPMVIEFGTNWCGICQGAQADIKAAMDNHPDVPHVKVEDGKGRRLGRTFGVKLWPTLIFLKDGEEIARVVRPDDSRDIEDALLKIR